MKKFFTLLMTMMMAAGVYADTWTVAGNNTDLFGTAWDPTNEANDLQLHSGTVYTWIKDVTAFDAINGVEFKVVKDHAWDTAYPAENYYIDVPAEAKYLVITFDESTNEVLAYGTWTVAGTEALFGSSWNVADADNLMDTEDGYTFTWTKTAVALPIGTTQEFKVAKDQKWETSYPSENKQLGISAAYAGTYDVNITFDAITKEVTASIVLNTVTTAYNLYGGSSDWTDMGAMTQNGNKFEYTINNQEGDADLTFAILPDFANNEGTIDWTKVVRPNADGDDNASWVLNFVVNTDKSAITGTSKNWKVLKGEQVTITYDPVSNFWSSKTFFTKTVKDNARNLATLGLPQMWGNVTVPEGMYLYKATDNGEQVTLTRVDGVTAMKLSETESVGLAVKAAAGTYTFEAAAEDGADMSNLFKGSNLGVTLAAGDLVLGQKAGVLGFYAVTEGYELGAHQAYLPASAGGKAIVFADETGINNISNVKEDNVYYDLQGRRVMNPTKGLFIVNGKKVIK